MGKNRYMNRFVPALSETVKVARKRGIQMVGDSSFEISQTKSPRAVQIGAKDCGFRAAVDQLLLSPKALANLSQSGLDFRDLVSKILRIEVDSTLAEGTVNLNVCLYPSDFFLGYLRTNGAGDV